MTWLDLVTPYYEEAKRQIKTFPCHTNRASALGGDCVRQLVYARSNWQNAVAHDVGLELVFREGRLQEEALLRDLAAAGIRLIEQQTALEWPEFQITGHIDAVVVVDDRAVPLEIKSMSDHIWNTVAKRGAGVYPWSEVAAAFEKKSWLRKYFAQLQLYCLLKGSEHAILLCKNKTSGAIAQVNVDLDYAYAEGLLQRADEINAHVACGTYPDRIEYDPDICGRCAWVHICLPDMVASDPIAFLSDGQIELRLNRRAELAESRTEYENLDAEVKAWAKAQGMNSIAIGEWLIEKKTTARGVRVDIRRLGGGNHDGVAEVA
jgi:CRISPR/Cas system-associated exonuclease Cas4 (RecB family)